MNEKFGGVGWQSLLGQNLAALYNRRRRHLRFARSNCRLIEVNLEVCEVLLGIFFSWRQVAIYISKDGPEEQLVKC